VQIPVVHANDLGAEREGMLHFVGVVDLDEGLHVEGEGVCVEGAETVWREHGDDEEDGVGAVEAGFGDLVLVEDELFAEDGGAVGEGIDGGTGEAEVKEGTVEPGGLGEDGDDGGA